MNWYAYTFPIVKIINNIMLSPTMTLQKKLFFSYGFLCNSGNTIFRLKNVRFKFALRDTLDAVDASYLTSKHLTIFNLYSVCQ